MSMKEKIKIGHYEADGGIINLPIGFIPDHFRLVAMITNPLVYEWWRSQQTEEATGAQEGIIDTAGTKTLAADDAGITAYSTGAEGPTVIEYADATTPTAKTATAPGTFVKPSAGNAQDRGSIYECVTSTGAVVTEPTWPSADGEQVTDDGLNVWEKVNVSKQRGGYQGVVVQDNIQTDGQEMYYVALAGDSVDHGDTAGWTDGIDPDA